MLPPDVRVARDTQDLLIECCVEFINLISSESNEVCAKEDKRTIAPEHVLKALRDTVRSGKLNNVVEMSEEEALAEQQRLFAEARARMNSGVVAAPQPVNAEAQIEIRPDVNNQPWHTELLVCKDLILYESVVCTKGPWLRLTDL